MDEQEQELLEGFRGLTPTTRKAVLTAVSLAVTAEAAVRQEYEQIEEGDKVAPLAY